MTRVVLGRRARKDTEALPWRLAEMVMESVGLLERNPDAGKPLQGRLRRLSSLRIGAYRIIYQVVDNGHTVRILTIRHRSVATKRTPAAEPHTRPLGFQVL